MAKMLKKLGPKTIMGVKIEAPEDDTLLYTIYGTAKAVRSGESNFGPWTALVGTFEAVRTHDGEVFTSSNCFLPEPVNSMVATSIRDSENESVEFAVEVYVIPREDLSIGYEYVAEPVAEVQGADPLAALRQKVVPQLENKKAQAKKKTA